MKRINLDQMKNMSIDNLIQLYRDGYRLEEHTPITSLSNLPNSSNNFSNIHTLQGPLLDPVINFGKVTVSTGYDAAATSIIITTNEGSKLPDPSSRAFNLVWWNSTDYPDPSDDPNKEIARCTAKTTDTLTVTRAQEGTSASVKNLVGKTYKMILTPTAKTISDISSHIGASIAHGTISDIVGISDIQTLTNKTLTSPFISTIYGGSVANDDITIEGTSNATKTSSYVILQPSDGNVGIGTTNPGEKLEVVQSGTGNSTPLCILTPSLTNGNISQIYLGKARGTNNLGTITFMQDASNSYLSIGNYGNSYALNVRYNGNVGIGTANPLQKVHIVSNNEILQLDNSTGATDSFVGLSFTPNGNKWEMGARGSADVNVPNGFFIFNTTDFAFRFAISDTGNVGIGTTTPDSKLHVAGSGKFSEVNPTLTLDSTSQTNDFFLQHIGADNRLRIGYATTEYFTILSGGNVGIGTATPATKLQILKDGSPTEGVDTFAILATGSYGGGIGFQDGTGDLGIWLDTAGTVAHFGFGTSGGALIEGFRLTGVNAYVVGNMSALSFTDRTPFYEGDALTELKAVKGIDGKIDHSTLPEFARKDNERDLGAMISILTKAVQQLTEKVEALEKKRK